MKSSIKLIILIMLSAISLYTSGCTGITPTFTVTYNGNTNTAGSVPVDSNVYETDESVIVLGKTDSLVKTGCSFKGWNTSANGSGINYTCGQIFNVRSESITLFAMWHTTIYDIGDTGPGGGFIFHKKISYSDGWQYLEAAPNTISNNTEWISKEWGSSGNLTGGAGTAGGNGKSNTALIEGWLNRNGETGCAAQLCSELTSGGYTDWFLPSKDELNLMYTNLKSAVPQSGDFSNGEYWSSSELNYVDAWSQNFAGGSQSSSNKTSTFRVRAARAF
jgi:hypothetical protein